MTSPIVYTQICCKKLYNKLSYFTAAFFSQTTGFAGAASSMSIYRLRVYVFIMAIYSFYGRRGEKAAPRLRSISKNGADGFFVASKSHIPQSSCVKLCNYCKFESLHLDLSLFSRNNYS